MDVERIPTVEELVPWMNLAEQAFSIAEKIAADAYDIRQLVSTIYTANPIGIYFHPEKQAVGVYIEPDTSMIDETLVKRAAETYNGTMADLTLTDLETGDWVKVAYSPTVRGAGEALGFFPMYNEQKQMTLPNSVYRSMLSSGLVGAGLGYGIGTVGEWMMPRKWKRGKLRNTLAALGGAAGVVPSTLWGISNKMTGRSFGDPAVLQTPAGAAPDWDMAKGAEFRPEFEHAVNHTTDKMVAFVKEAWESEAGGAYDQRNGSSPLDVNIDYLGRTLWQTGASPQTAGVTLGTLGAAQQMPGGSKPGWVTPMQMGNLAAHMGAGWASGALVGTVLGALTGMPESAQDKLKSTGMYLGIVKSVVPSLFG